MSYLKYFFRRIWYYIQVAKKIEVIIFMLREREQDTGGEPIERVKII